MKQTSAVVGWLMFVFASASFGSDGQHTGVGGNPFVPPPNPSSLVLPRSQPQMLVIPGLLLVQPDVIGQDAPKSGEASQTEGTQDDKSKDGEPSAQ